MEENRFWLSLADSDVELWARGVAYGNDYDVTVKEIDVGPLQVQGPKSKDVMVDLFGEASSRSRTTSCGPSRSTA